MNTANVFAYPVFLVSQLVSLASQINNSFIQSFHLLWITLCFSFAKVGKHFVCNGLELLFDERVFSGYRDYPECNESQDRNQIYGCPG